MRHFPKLLVLASALCLAAHAAEPAAEFVATFKDTAPTQARGTISTYDMPIASRAPGVSAPTNPVSLPLPDATTAGLPSIAAAGAPSAAAPVPGPAAFTPGAPLKTYATLKDAADAGIDPLRVEAVMPPVSTPAVEVATGVTDWASARDWAQAHPTQALSALGGAMVLLAGGLFWTRRRAAQR